MSTANISQFLISHSLYLGCSVFAFLQVAAYRKGKTKVLNALVGKVLKETQSRADAAIVKDILTKKLSS